MKRKRMLLAGLIAGLCLSVRAVEVSSIFADGMVLQQGMNVPVWGWAESGATVNVSFSGQRVTGTAGGAGKWLVWLTPLKVSSRPQVMTVQAGTEEPLVIKDVLIGDVWLCSGQSNMGMGMAGVDHAKQEMAKANFPGIRAFDVAHIPAENPRERVAGSWLPCRPDKMPLYSAMAYYFARRIHEEANIPVGIVVAAWGGSSVAAWMSHEALLTEPVRSSLAQDIFGWQINHRQSRLFNGMIHPLIPYAVSGMIWYQGESDSDSGINPYCYRLALPQMIQDWRSKWNRPDLPVYLVQLPNMSRPDDNWAVTRESQEAVLALPETGMITTIDIGQDRKLHPTNKKEFGERLANLVLQKKYGFSADAESPVFQKSSFENGGVRLSFNAGGGNLKTTDGQVPREFQVAGDNRQFVEAEARIEGTDVRVFSSQVSVPVAVRYAWKDNPDVNLCGENGLPVRPFRTDDWTVAGENEVWKALPAKAVLETRWSPLEIAADQSADWKWCGSPSELPADYRKNCLRQHPAGLFLSVKPLWMRRSEDVRPTLCWETTDESPLRSFDPSKGCTLTLCAQVSDGTDPFYGLDLHLELPRQNGSLYRYRLSIQPLRIYGFTEKGVHVLAADLANTTRQCAYRIAIRPDGGAQLYMDSMPVGMLPVEEVKTTGVAVPSFRWGKLDRKNRLDAKVSRIEMDMTGGFAPVQ